MLLRHPRWVLALVAAAVITAFGGCVAGWPLPGSTAGARVYGAGEDLPIRMDKLTSAKALLPFSYYHLPFCRPPAIERQYENLGEILQGSRVESSLYVAQIGQQVSCRLLCSRNLSRDEVLAFIGAIDNEYTINPIADQLPAALRIRSGVAPLAARLNDQAAESAIEAQARQPTDGLLYGAGVPIGYMSIDGLNRTATGAAGVRGYHVILNHLDFRVELHPVAAAADLGQSSFFFSAPPKREAIAEKSVPQFYVVGFSVAPRSIQHKFSADSLGVSPDNLCEGTGTVQSLEYLLERPEQNADGALPNTFGPNGEWAPTLTFSYSVEFERSDKAWSHRWDSYVAESAALSEVHWFSIVNALVIMLLLSGVLGLILLRTLLQDIARYNRLDDLEDSQEEFGWKLVHGDVFRRPTRSKTLAVCAGTGVQVTGMGLVTLLFGLMGLLGPAHRGALLQAMVILFALMGAPAGFVSARFNKLFEGSESRGNVKVALMTALQFPGVCFLTFFALNGVLYHQGSSAAVPFSRLLLLLLVWFGISVPLVLLGSRAGYTKPTISIPVRTNQIPRQLPPRHWTATPLISHSATGTVPFCVVFTELLFVITYVWQQRFYCLYGFAALVFLILAVTCAEISIVATYFSLCAEDYRWWWRSYWAGAASAIYVFLYASFYFFSRLRITDLVPGLLYFAYTFLMSYGFFLFTGATGFISSFFFVRAIYGAVKVD